MYHGTDQKELDLDADNPSTGGFDLCLARSKTVAEKYATRFSDDGRVFDLELARDADIADEETVREILDIGPDASTGQVFLAVDAGLDQLREAGYDAVRYTDSLPGSVEQNQTTRVIRRGYLKVVNCQPVGACDRCGDQFENWDEFDICEGCV